MDMIVPIVSCRLLTRLIFHLIDRNQQKKESIDEKLRRLQELLLKIHATIEETQGRHITNQQMLLQLKEFFEDMYRGYYVFDTFKILNIKDDDDMAGEKHQSFASSLFNPAKRLRMLASNAKVSVFGEGDVSRLQTAIEKLEVTTGDLHAFNALLGCYPRRFRQPYSAYLDMDNCMIGRQVEKQQIINFLLQTEPSSSTVNVGVLPVIGHPQTGKRTLVESVCSDERVRNYFTFIIKLKGQDLEKGTSEAQRVILGMQDKKISTKKCLIVVEFASNVDNYAWRRFCFYTSKYLAAGSKIIVTSSKDDCVNLGTTNPIRLMYLSEEAHWYLFRVLAFGSANPEEHPKLVTIAMRLAKMFQGSFMCVKALGRVLRGNLDIQFWSLVLKKVLEPGCPCYISPCNHQASQHTRQMKMHY